MNKLQIAQLAWANKKNKENLDLSMQEMGKSLENLVTAMASVDPKVTLSMLDDISSQVEEQSKNYEMRIVEEKGEFVEAYLENLPGDELEEVDEEELSAQEKLAALKKTEH